MGNNYFRNKTIVILSPQPWEGLLISKHHYALALAEQNYVYFIPAPQIGTGYKLNKPEKGKKLFVLQYQLLVPEFLKFHAKNLYKYFVRKRLSRILNNIVPEIDVVLDFGCYQQMDTLKWIKAKKKIFFPVDDSEYLRLDSRGADLVLSVSQNICDKFKTGGITCYFINHGLAPVFAKVAGEVLDSLVEWKRRATLRVAYSGNLFIPFLDREVFAELILSNPEIEFNFYGNDIYKGADQNMNAWSKVLHTASNIRLNGLLKQDELARAYQDIDIFILCYKPDYKNFHGENSHKIFEYLSTGKILVSTYISLYDGTDLFEMTAKDNNEQIRSVFAEVVKNLELLNSAELQSKRISLALDNVYTKQIERINELFKSAS